MAGLLTRRKFLKVAGATAAAATMGTVLPLPRLRAQAGPVRIGYAISETGPFSIGAGITQIPNYLLWLDEVNAKGGLLVAGGGRRPVEFVKYDDRSDIETMVRLYERLITVDKVDLVLPPWGTAANFAVAPVTNRHGYPLIGPTVGSMRLRDLGLPYFYAILAQPDAMMSALVAYLKELRATSKLTKVAVIHVADLFGVEHYQALMPLLQQGGFEVVEDKSYPFGVQDLSDTLKGIAAKRPDVFIGLTYPADTNLAVNQSSGVAFSPAVFYTAVGTAFPAFRDNFKAKAEGVMGIGAWNPKVRYRGAREYFAAHVRKFNREPDRWASAFAYSSLKILEEAVEKVGLDRARMKAYIDATQFNTIVGPVKFVGGVNRATPGMVGQWQKGEFEVVWPRALATAAAVVPKPAWQ
ncbi:MAG: amino acid ABC transporter substrate-binding protein [bacterium]